MTRSINVGIDFGSLGWRAAYVAGEQIICLPTDTPNMPQEKWLLCEPSPAHDIGMTFPSIKSKIGSGAKISIDGKAHALDDFIMDEFRTLKAKIEEHASHTVEQAVLSVPASYSAYRRAGLRDAALKAGFTDVHLLNDSMAAVMAYTNQSTQSATLLVYSMGYTGFELGLVRAVRGRYRALGYEAGEAPCGATLDTLILRAWIAHFSQQNLGLNPHPRQWTPELWLQMRLASQQAKENLSTANTARFPIHVQRHDSSEAISVGFQRPDFEVAIRQSVDATLELAENMLEEANLSPEDLDAVLMMGGSTRIPLIPVLLEKHLGKQPVLLDAEALAKGAALYAMQLEVPVARLGEAVEAPAESVEIETAESAMVATVTTSETDPTQSPDEVVIEAVSLHELHPAPATAPRDTAPNGVEMALQHARRLVEQGQHSQAETFLQGLIKDAQELLETVRNVPTPTVPKNAEWAISKAYRLLKQGKHDEAVPQSHLAWQLAPDSPEIFDQMLDVHCQAGMAKTSVEDYTMSRHWLECALSHDQSSTKVRQALAERHYIQAKQLVDGGKRKDARDAVELCLQCNPEHEKGNELFAVL